MQETSKDEDRREVAMRTFALAVGAAAEEMQRELIEARNAQTQCGRLAIEADPTDAKPCVVTPDEVARRLLRERHMRSGYLGCDLFQDPAWDVLLTAYVHDGAMVKIVAGACGLPATTGQRWIEHLVRSGHLHKRVDPDDRRVIGVGLTPAARSGMESYLMALTADRA